MTSAACKCTENSILNPVTQENLVETDTCKHNNSESPILDALQLLWHKNILLILPFTFCWDNLVFLPHQNKLGM